MSGIINGDCSAMKMLDGKFDVVIADPPYNIGKDYGICRDNMPEGAYVEWVTGLLSIALGKIKDGGLVYCYGFPEWLARIAARFPVDRQRFLQWHYINKNFPGIAFFQRSHESILTLWNGKRPKLQIDSIRVPYESDFPEQAGKLRTGNNKGKLGTSPEKDHIFDPHPRGKMPQDVLKYPAMAGGFGERIRGEDGEGHPTQKPSGLTETLIRAVCGDDCRGRSVLIPFAGSGSECVVATRLGMEFVAYEISPQYAAMADEAVKRERQKPTSNYLPL